MGIFGNKSTISTGGGIPAPGYKITEKRVGRDIHYRVLKGSQELGYVTMDRNLAVDYSFEHSNKG